MGRAETDSKLVGNELLPLYELWFAELFALSQTKNRKNLRQRCPTDN